MLHNVTCFRKRHRVLRVYRFIKTVRACGKKPHLIHQHALIVVESSSWLLYIIKQQENKPPDRSKNCSTIETNLCGSWTQGTSHPGHGVLTPKTNINWSRWENQGTKTTCPRKWAKSRFLQPTTRVHGIIINNSVKIQWRKDGRA